MRLIPNCRAWLIGHRTAVKLILFLFGLFLLNQSAPAQSPLTNGITADGTLAAGEQETWSFPAKTGDGIFLKLGEAVVGSSLYPRLRLYGPGGVLLGESVGTAMTEVTARATNSGTFLVTVANAEGFAPGGSGPYRLTLAKTGAMLFVASYDEGGPLTNGVVYSATNGVAGVDAWTFNACHGDAIFLQITKLVGGAGFSPELLLYAPDGTLLNRVSGTTIAQVSRIAPMPGSYLLLATATNAGLGIYQLTGSGFSNGLKLCPPQILGADLVIKGIGGRVGSNYVWLATTNIALPPNLWTAIRTNQPGAFGEFTVTNEFKIEVPQQYFRVRLP